MNLDRLASDYQMQELSNKCKRLEAQIDLLT